MSNTPITIIMSSIVPGPSPTEPESTDAREDSTTWPSAEAALTSLALAAASLATPEREDGET